MILAAATGLHPVPGARVSAAEITGVPAECAQDPDQLVHVLVREAGLAKDLGVQRRRRPFGQGAAFRGELDQGCAAVRGVRRADHQPGLLEPVHGIGD